MTFVLNVLHSEFSLIAADTKAVSKGPTTIKMSGITLFAKKGVTIQGYQKIKMSRSKNVAVGHSGNVEDHVYLGAIENQDSIGRVLYLIRAHTENFLEQDHKSVVEHRTFVENAGIATYYEPETGICFSNIYAFSRIHNYMKQFAGGERACLIHVGSGSSVFECAVGLEEINRFVGSVQSSSDIPYCIEWMKESYKKVSSVDEGTGEEMVAFLATRDRRLFVPVAGR